MKKSKSLAEYAMRKWMESEELAMEHFKLELTGSREAMLKDEKKTPCITGNDVGRRSTQDQVSVPCGDIKLSVYMITEWPEKR